MCRHTFRPPRPGILYSPRNYDGRYRGPLLARRALAGSENVPAVALASRLGVPRLLRFLARGGLSTFDQNASFYGLGVTLGNAEVRLDELVAAYAAFARGGMMGEADMAAGRRQCGTCRNTLWSRHGRRSGSPTSCRTVRPANSSSGAVVISSSRSRRGQDRHVPGVPRQLDDRVHARRDRRRVGRQLRSLPVARFNGVTGAGPIFHAVMLAAVARVKPAGHFGDPAVAAARPDGLLERRVCALSGMVANEWCPSRQREWLPAGDDKVCDWHRHTAAGVQVAWPAGYRAWAAQQDLLEEAPPMRASAAAPRCPVRARGWPRTRHREPAVRRDLLDRIQPCVASSRHWLFEPWRRRTRASTGTSTTTSWAAHPRRCR